MFKIGDRVRHKTTGFTGKVIGYGERRVSDSYYATTLKVELRSDTSIAPTAEDIVEKWKLCQEKRVLACTLPYFPKRHERAELAST